MSNKLLAIDPSLTASGWALFELSSGKLFSLGVLRSLPSEVALEERFRHLQDQIIELLTLLKMSPGDILICEGSAHLVLNPQSALKLERVRGIFETVARILKLNVPGRINPRTVHIELLGMRGKQMSRKKVKDSARIVAERLYQKELLSYKKLCKSKNIPQDIIDALLIGTIALSRVKLASSHGQNLDNYFENSRKKQRTRNQKGRGLRWEGNDLFKLYSR